MCAGPSFDNLIRPDQKGLGNRQSQRLRRFPVDDHLDLRRLLNGQVDWLRPLENAIDVLRRGSAALHDIGAVKHQRACLGSGRLAGQTRQAVLERQLRELTTVMPEEANVVDVQWFGSEALELTYKTPVGKVANELLYRHDESRLEVVEE